MASEINQFINACARRTCDGVRVLDSSSRLLARAPRHAAPPVTQTAREREREREREVVGRA